MLTAFKLLMSLISLVIALIPVWIFLVFKWLLAPEGFWQNLILLILGLSFFGFIQLVLICIWIWFVCSVWSAPELQNRGR